MRVITLTVIDGIAACEHCRKQYTGKAKRWVHDCHSSFWKDNPNYLCTDAGTILHGRLAQLWIKPKGCKCLARIRLMNTRGPEWCRDNVEKIVGWLREAAKERRIPFIEYAARYIVEQSIKEALTNLARIQEQARGRVDSKTD